MTLKNASEPQRKEKLGGTGEGWANAFYVPIPLDGQGAFTMSARIELEPGASIGYHQHADNEEVYFILGGNGIYTEEGDELNVSFGDVLLCRMGRSHGIRNTGSVPLIVGAAIARRN